MSQKGRSRNDSGHGSSGRGSPRSISWVRGLRGESGSAICSNMYIPPTVLLFRTLGLALAAIGVEPEMVVPCLECVGKRALPGVAGRSLRSVVASDKSLGLKFDEAVFLCICGGIGRPSWKAVAGSSSPTVEFDRILVKAGVTGDSVESVECIEASGVMGSVLMLILVLDADRVNSPCEAPADGISSKGA